MTAITEAKSNASLPDSDAYQDRAEANSTTVEGDEITSYKRMSQGAVLSVILGLLSISGFLFQPGVALAIVGAGLGVVGYLGIKRYPEELTGTKVALAGILLCLATFSGAIVMHTYIYLTEVPDDHERLTFRDIKAPTYDKYRPTEKAIELHGKKVFLKGYTFPSKQKKNLSNFLLVGDFGQCCFGGDPEPTHLVKITIKGSRKIDYSQRLRKLTGTFRVLQQLSKDDEGKPFIYELVADEIK